MGGIWSYSVSQRRNLLLRVMFKCHCRQGNRWAVRSIVQGYSLSLQNRGHGSILSYTYISLTYEGSICITKIVVNRRHIIFRVANLLMPSLLIDSRQISPANSMWRHWFSTPGLDNDLFRNYMLSIANKVVHSRQRKAEGFRIHIDGVRADTGLTIRGADRERQNQNTCHRR